MTYDELIKLLRSEECVPYTTMHIMRKAAEAIEALTAYVRQIEELRKGGYFLQKTKMMTYGQATMTMPLPTPPKEETE